MGPPVNCKICATLILFLILLSPVAAAPLNDSNPAPEIYTETSGPEPFTIILFIPSSNMIHSDQVLDQVNTLDGNGVLFGTSFGLSLYNGTWSTRHINRDNISEGLMDEFITAIEYDHGGNLWIGYPGGIQIFNGISYQTLRNQQLFKDTRIQDLQRWHDDMWVATGHSGLHRFRDGTWTWFQPMTRTGPGFYEIREMVLDTHSNSLIFATADNGLWIVRSPDNPVMFEQIAPKYGSNGLMTHVKRDPNGGVYFFNDTSVLHYSPDAGFIPVLTAKDLTMATIEINDLSAGPDGIVYLATDDGIYFWKNGGIVKHISRFEGIGTSEIVRTVTIDSRNRVWFSTNGYVGYYLEQAGPQKPLRIEIVTPQTESVPINQTGVLTPARTSPIPADAAPEAPTGGLAPVIDPVLHALSTILSKLGITFS
jgi:hypothetical protein